MGAWGAAGTRVHVEAYGELLKTKVAAIKDLLAPLVAHEVLDTLDIFASRPEHHRHRATFELRPGVDALQYSMWDPVEGKHTTVSALDVPIFSRPITAAMELLQRQRIELTEFRAPPEARDVSDDWRQVVGQGLRSVQFHSTLSRELIVCLVYHDERLKNMKRSQLLPDEEAETARWVAAAKILRQRFLDADIAARVDVIGRWKRRRRCVERDYVNETMELDGRTLTYTQPEGQFSNPNAECEVCCLQWLCREARCIREVLGPVPAHLLELHAGAGTNTVALAPIFDEVAAVEINRVLTEAAERNSQANGLRNVRLIRASTMEFVTTMDDASGSRQAVLVDPPRSGLDAATREFVARHEHVLYISCNPLALADDLKLLGETHQVMRFAIFDMFPYTSHTECAARLQRKAPSPVSNV